MRTKLEFETLVKNLTNKELGTDYTIEFGTHSPYLFEGMMSSGPYEGYKIRINSNEFLHIVPKYYEDGIVKTIDYLNA